MNIAEISQGVYYVGVNDRTTHLFEGLWKLPQGVSYNSYLVKGEKIALIDTVHVSQCTNFLERIVQIIGDAPIDYLVINHMEPDHSGSVKLIKQFYPNVKIVGNSKTAGMIEGYYGITDNVITVADGEVLDLGAGKELKFVLTPMVHWPETMVTYLESNATLFSGDAFGCFGALSGGIVDSEMDCERFFGEMRRYYAGIVAKYGMFVKKAIDKFNDVKIDYVCSTHGPVWHENIAKVVGLYSDMAQWKAERGVVIAYASMYGHTEAMADCLARELSVLGVKSISVHNLCECDKAQVLADVCRYKAIVVAGPVYNSSLFPPVEDFLQALKGRDVKNRTLSVMGSYTWGPLVVKKVAAMAEEMKLPIVGDGFDVKQAMTATDKEKCEALAKAIVESLG